ncbi:MAG: T9SS type A sorting domain-containing protein [Lewinellaceae bacterium]|nr:T9SS type A sorting domain-containing protein [Lewinellaceae bacterium]
MQYLIESAICLAVLYGFYHVFLRQETFFQLNRGYLLLAALLALALPALNIPLQPAPESAAVQQYAPANTLDFPKIVEQMQVAPQGIQHVLTQPVWKITLGELLWWIYLAVAGVMLFRLAVQLTNMIRFLWRFQTGHQAGVRVVSGPEGTPLASFFGFVLWHPGAATDPAKTLMLEHEMVHVRQWHSLDILFIELLIAIQWFNPMLYLYRRGLREVHEYIADDIVVRRTRQRYAYAALLAQNIQSGKRAHPGLVNTFHSLIKNRLIMLAKHPSQPSRQIKILLALPLFVVLMALFSFRLAERLPAASHWYDAVGLFEGNLKEVIILADKPVLNEPTTYIFYWGALQVKIEKDPATGRYFGEASLSVAEFQEAVKREPRLWNGTSLEQHVSFKMQNNKVRSDYYKEEVYLQIKPSLQVFSASKTDAEQVLIEDLQLPDGHSASISISLGGETPSWIIAKSGSETYWNDDPLFFAAVSQNDQPQVRCGGIMTTQKAFCTTDEFWSMVQTAPELVYPDGRKEICNSGLYLLLMKPGGLTPAEIPVRPSMASRDWESISKDLHYYQDWIQPGTDIAISQKLNENGVDERISSRTLLAVTIVSPNDPRLFLDRSDRSNFRFSWGDFERRFNSVYARAYEDSAIPGRMVYADRPAYGTPWYMSKAEFLRMLKNAPLLYHGEQPVEDINLTVDHQGYGFVVNKKPLDPAILKKMENDLHNGDQININAIQGRANNSEQIIAPKAIFEQFSSRFTAREFAQIEQPSGQTLIRIILDDNQFQNQDQKNKLNGQPGVWFQYGDIDLSQQYIQIIIREDSPKPPLKGSFSASLASEMSIAVSPNPVRDSKAMLTIKVPLAGKGTLYVTDANGKARFTVNSEFTKGDSPLYLPLDLIKLKEPGTYYVTLEMPYGKVTTKLVVQ